MQKLQRTTTLYCEKRKNYLKKPRIFEEKAIESK